MWVYTQVNLDSKSGEGKNALVAPISSYLFYAIKVITVSVTVSYLWRWKQTEQFSQDIMLPSTKPGLGKGAGRCCSVFVCLRPLGAIPQVMLAVVLQTFWCLTVNSQHGVMKVPPGNPFSFLSVNFWGVQLPPCVSRRERWINPGLCPMQRWCHAGIWFLWPDGAGGGTS